MRGIRLSLAPAACLLAFVVSNNAFAQASVVADKLFRQAVDEMNARNFASACPLLERSYQLDPKDGTLFTLANCRDLEGKSTLAMGHYRAYLRVFEKMTGATRQKHEERASKAQARLTDIEATIPKVKFIWETAPPPESKIIVDGVEFRADTLDVLLPLDPGTHEIVVQLPGEPNRKRTVTLAKGGSSIIDLTPAKPGENDVDVPDSGGPKDKIGGANKSKKVDPAKIGGFVGIGLGAAGLITGGITGYMAMKQKETVDARCNANYICDPVGTAAVDRFRTFGTASTVSFIAGGVLAGVGVTLLLVSRRNPTFAGVDMHLRAVVLPGQTNWSIEGAF